MEVMLDTIFLVRIFSQMDLIYPYYLSSFDLVVNLYKKSREYAHFTKFGSASNSESILSQSHFVWQGGLNRKTTNFGGGGIKYLLYEWHTFWIKNDNIAFLRHEVQYRRFRSIEFWKENLHQTVYTILRIVVATQRLGHNFYQLAPFLVKVFISF